MCQLGVREINLQALGHFKTPGALCNAQDESFHPLPLLTEEGHMHC